MDKRTVLFAFVTLIYATILIFLIMYFVLINNPVFLLFSFPVLVALILILSIDKKMIVYIAQIGIILIITSFMTYTELMIPLYMYVMAGALIFTLFLIIDEISAYKFQALAIIALPILYDLLGFKSVVNALVNIAILGFYIVAAVAFSVFLINIVPKGFIKSLYSLKKLFIQDLRYIIIIAIVGLALISINIWPIQPFLNVKVLPYVNVSLTNNADNINLYSISFNYSNFSNMENINASNIRLYHSNGSIIPAYMYRYNNTVHMFFYINGMHDRTIRLYFLPVNFSFDNELVNLNINRKMYGILLNKKLYSTMINAQSIHNYYNSQINMTFKAIKRKLKFYNTTYNSTVYSPYEVQTLCPDGMNTSIMTHIQSNNTFDFFVVDNVTALLRLADRLNATDYNTVVSKIGALSSNRILNARGINISLDNISACTYYGLVFSNYSEINVDQKELYYVNVTFSLKKAVFSEIAGNAAIKGYSNIFSGYRYLINNLSVELTDSNHT